MSRYIKFRAWDKNDQMMYEVHEMVFSATGIDWMARGDHAIAGWRGDAEFMQYTGLKDKNGVEIYEGDIVKGQYRNYTVEHLGAAFRLKSTDGSTPDLLPVLENSERIEVIGNIYESPELLGTNGKEGDK